jgi:hypothetical protein
MKITRPIPVLLESTLGTNTSFLQKHLPDYADGACMTMMGFINGTLPPPEGTSVHFAYQKFSYELDGSAASQAEIHGRRHM